MMLATERGETINNILTIYPIQSVHCVKGLLLMNTLWPQNRMQDLLSKRHAWCFDTELLRIPTIMGVRDLQIKSKLGKTRSSSSRNTISYSYGYILGDHDDFYLIIHLIKLINILLPYSYRITISHCLADYARLGYPSSLPIGEATCHQGA